MFITVKSNYGLRQSGKIILKTPHSDPFDVSEDKARELESRGIAVIIEESATESVNLSKMKLDQLKALANERGIEGADDMKKAELIEAISTQTEGGDSKE